ncbi:MAG: ImmA/IrrE family metallo-endopeptidase [Burkholderiaceae bacterium]|nr:ImmA/IrrE family metallo-endopeptidase [Burkholderiaceae bacterium]
MSQRQLSIEQVSEKLGCAPNTVSALLSGNARISEALATRLGDLIGTSRAFWLTRDQQFVSDLKRIHHEEVNWVRSLPMDDMIRLGWIDRADAHSERLRACLAYFNAADLDEWESTWLDDRVGLTAYRTSPSFANNAAAVAAWLRRGEIECANAALASWSQAKFRATLSEIRSLTRVKEPERFLPRLKDLCAACGVAVVVVRTPRGCHASGATRFTSDSQAILQLSARHLSDDHFWFSFFHEAAHLLLHGKRLFLEMKDVASPEEREADLFAEQLLLPPECRHEFESVRSRARDIVRFARKIGIAPGIVVGQLQHHGRLAPARLNWLKRRYVWQ